MAPDEFPAAHTPESAAGIDPVMADRFARFLDIAAEYGMPLMEELTRRVREDGTAPYLSMDGGMLSEFSEITGFIGVDCSALRVVAARSDRLYNTIGANAYYIDTLIAFRSPLVR